MWSHVIIAVWMTEAVLVVCNAAPIHHFCDDYDASVVKPSDPKFPKIPPTVEAYYEINFKEYKDTFLFELHYDAVNHIASESIKTPNETNLYFYDYNKTFFYYVHDNHCHSVPYEIDEPNNKMPTPFMIPKRHQMFPSRDILSIPATTHMKYIGQETIRGITVNHWQTCLNMDTSPYYNYSVLADYYFSRNWFSATTPGILKRIVIKGLTKNENKLVQNRTDTMDFSVFRDHIQDRSVFEIPPGIICTGDNVTMRHTPPSPSDFQAGYQIVEYQTNRILEGQIYWDSTDQIHRIDQRYITSQNSYSWPAISTISDLATGVKYVIKRADNTCQAFPIKSQDISQTIKYSHVMNGTYHYNGKIVPLDVYFVNIWPHNVPQRRLSGVDYDVYITDSVNNDTIFEFLFTAPQWKYISDHRDAKAINTQVLSQVNTYSKMNHTKLTMATLFDYAPLKDDAYSAFNVRKCMSEKYMAEIELVIQPDGQNSYYYISTEKLRRAVRLKLVELGKVSFIRIQKDEIRRAYPKFYYLFTLYGKPDDILKFHTNKVEVTAVETEHKKTNIKSATDCAHQCLLARANCSSFDYCGKSQMCRMSKKEVSEGGPVTPKETCIHYTQNVKSPKPETSTWDATDMIDNAIFQYKFKISIGNKPRQQTATVEKMRYIYNGKDVTKSSNINDVDVKLQFKVRYNTIIYGYNHKRHERMSADNCAKECLNHAQFRCESFEYCYKTSDCYLSKKHPGDVDVRLVQDSNNIQYQCDLYSRSYSTYFAKSSGYSAITTSPSTYQYVKDAKYCAQLCMKNDAFDCLSFQYCKIYKRCVLSEKHKENHVKVVNTTETCYHYYRHYYYDYKIYRYIAVVLKPSDAIAEYVGIDNLECGKRCSDEGPDCLGWDYCYNYQNKKWIATCKMTSKSKYAMAATSKVSTLCSHASKKIYSDGTRVTTASIALLSLIKKNQNNTNAAGSHSHNPTSHYVGGDMAGLAIGMIILTCLMLVAAGYAYLKIRGKTVDSDFVVKLSKLKEID